MRHESLCRSTKTTNFSNRVYILESPHIFNRRKCYITHNSSTDLPPLSHCIYSLTSKGKQDTTGAGDQFMQGLNGWAPHATLGDAPPCIVLTEWVGTTCEPRRSTIHARPEWMGTICHRRPTQARPDRVYTTCYPKKLTHARPEWVGTNSEPRKSTNHARPDWVFTTCYSRRHTHARPEWVGATCEPRRSTPHARPEWVGTTCYPRRPSHVRPEWVGTICYPRRPTTMQGLNGWASLASLGDPPMHSLTGWAPGT
jgi:hypothetical protein